MPAAGWLAERLGVEPGDAGLLARALTHRSHGSPNNERLEYLGDAVLTFVVAEMLYRSFPDASEGELSRYRATLVSGEALAGIAASIGLGEHLRLGEGEMKSGGHRRATILADALEAVFGAIYLDLGLGAARRVAERLFHPSIAALPSAAELKDPKTRLQEWLQGRGHPLPAYTVLEVSGEPHEQRFRVQCEVPGLGLAAVAEGSSRRRAEQEAAQRILEDPALNLAR
ncbi:MAG TPA: ribonuclease III [Steroidobacteraceae bacterium]|nr:ribonuclease III [Steroidobacteraceae bacterium]